MMIMAFVRWNVEMSGPGRNEWDHSIGWPSHVVIDVPTDRHTHRQAGSDDILGKKIMCLSPQTGNPVPACLHAWRKH